MTTTAEAKPKKPRLNVPFHPRGESWTKVREAFIDSEARPKLVELANEFGLPAPQVQLAAADEGWAMARAARIEQKLAEADAGAAVLQAVKASRAIVGAGETAGLVLIQSITRLAVEIIESEKADTTKTSALNTLSFALNNTSNAMKSLGIVGFAGELKANNTDGNNRWKPELLQQINVTVQGLMAKEAPVTVSPIQPEPADCV